MLPERFSDEWFELIQNWEGDHFQMVEEYQTLLDYRHTQQKLEEFPKKVRDRIHGGG